MNKVYKVKMNKKGQITVPKIFREWLDYVDGTTFKIDVVEGILRLEPLVYCRRCGRAMPESFRGALVCEKCPPITSFIMR